ncbi:MAG: dual specificity protein phosphatase family protein [Candidatus Riflebacteria bacterium]|nr:dual specificity protein phosphatase family protein [Candidatus Riflebacteria bacterium]
MSESKPVLPGRCYWVIPGRFLAGNFPYNPGIDNPHDFLHCLLDSKIDTFIDLTEEDELVHYQPLLAQITSKDIVYRRFAIVDYSVPGVAEMQEVVAIINQLLEEGRHIYLHCRGGIGRTGTVVGCWLCSQGYNGNAALDELAKLFSASNAARFTRSPETEEQRDFVKGFISSERKPQATE